MEAGSEVVLQCSVKDYLKKPTFIFWYLDNERLLHDTSGVTIVDNVDDKTHQIDSNLAPVWHQNASRNHPTSTKKLTFPPAQISNKNASTLVETFMPTL